MGWANRKECALSLTAIELQPLETSTVGIANKVSCTCLYSYRLVIKQVWLAAMNLLNTSLVGHACMYTLWCMFCEYVFSYGRFSERIFPVFTVMKWSIDLCIFA